MLTKVYTSTAKPPGVHLANLKWSVLFQFALLFVCILASICGGFSRSFAIVDEGGKIGFEVPMLLLKIMALN